MSEHFVICQKCDLDDKCPAIAEATAAQAVCLEAEKQLAEWEKLYPDRKDDSPDYKAVRALVDAWREAVQRRESGA